MQRLSGLDASFLYLETPTMHMHVGLVAVLDPAKMPGGRFDFERVHHFIDRGVRTQPQLMRRVVEVPLQIDHPRWFEEPQVDTLHHVRRVDCPAPGSLPELAALVARIMSTPLDRGRPLWEVWIIEGLEGGRFALVAKVHHAIADGVSGAQILSALFSGSPSAEPKELPEVTTVAEEPVPNEVDLLRDALLARIARPREIVRMFKRTSNALLDLYEKRRSSDHEAGATVFDSPRTRFNGPLSAARSVAFARVSLDNVKVVRKAFNASANEVVLAICAGALRAYLEARGELPEAPLIAACPIATRVRGTTANKVSAMVTALATNLESPAERLRAIRTVTRHAKQEHDALGGDLIRSWAELMTPGLVTTAARLYSKYRLSELHRPIFNLMISNVPGPRSPIYFAGAELVAAYPLGPISEGAALNITVMTYTSHVDFGFVTTPSLVDDLHALAALVPAASRELVEAAETVSALPSDAAEEKSSVEG